MGEIEEKIGAVLNNPQLMQQIMAMAQSMGSTDSATNADPPEPQPRQTQSPLPDGIDLGSIQRIAGLAQRSQIDNNQRTLLRALRPYLSSDRISKLEKAMRAARLAGVVTTVLGGSGSLFFPGR